MNLNPNNYGNREACQRLVAAGIVEQRKEAKHGSE
jgi:hypothetical protein